MKCYACQHSKLMDSQFPVQYSYEGEPVIIPGVQGLVCETCDAFIIDKEEAVKITAFMLEHQKNNLLSKDSDYE